MKSSSKKIDTINITLFGPCKEIHEKWTRVPESFNQTIKGIENWKQIGGGVEIESIVSEYNKDEMYEFVDFILNKETIHVF